MQSRARDRERLRRWDGGRQRRGRFRKLITILLDPSIGINHFHSLRTSRVRMVTNAFDSDTDTDSDPEPDAEAGDIGLGIANAEEYPCMPASFLPERSV